MSTQKKSRKTIVVSEAQLRAARTIIVTEAQVSAAKAIVERAARSGEDVRSGVRRIAEAKHLETRAVTLVLGDWSDDGHGKTDTVLVELAGKDLSDTALRASYDARATELGVELWSICENYEEGTISQELYDKLLAAGYSKELAWDSDQFIPVEGAVDFALTPDAPEVGIGAVQLAMFYLSATIENFSWRVMENDYPTLLGGYGTILRNKTNNVSTSFGYGLFV